MLISLAGAMSTAELGISLAEMIRQGKVDIISCTGANLEEDIMNLVAHSHYKRVPNYRDLSPDDEWDLLEHGFNRVTDTCIPEEEAFRRIQKHIFKEWKTAEENGERFLPHEYMYKMLLSGVMEQYYEIDPKNSWMLAAAERNLPIIVPGWEDSTMGNIFASYCIKGELKASTMKSGIEYMMWLTDWYRANSGGQGVGFYQIGGGIAGDVRTAAGGHAVARPDASGGLPAVDDDRRAAGHTATARSAAAPESGRGAGLDDGLGLDVGPGRPAAGGADAGLPEDGVRTRDRVSLAGPDP